MIIVLIGYRGSGKTTVGRLLAERLSWAFADTDEHIVAAAGMNIKEIFEKYGEDRFREMETAAILKMTTLDNQVVSLGGGALLRVENREALLGADPMSVYLRADATELHRRIHSDLATAAQRPSLTHLGGGIEEIRTILAQREPIYRKVMDAEIDVTYLSPLQVVDQILKIIPQT